MLEIRVAKRELFFHRIGGQREPLSHQVAERIINLIATRKLQPGDILPSQQELCEKFGVSRTVIREGLQVLSGLGVIRISQGVRAQVIETDPAALSALLRISAGVGKKGMENLLTVREILEPEIAALAATAATAEHIARMESAIDAMEETLRNPKRYIIHDNAFHLALAEATGNVLLSHIIYPIVNLLQEMRRVSVTVNGATERAQTYHRAILEHVKSHDPNGARLTMQAHLAQVRGELSAANGSRG
jgi:DNA-binding FadR family transcriptional regulator